MARWCNHLPVACVYGTTVEFPITCTALIVCPLFLCHATYSQFSQVFSSDFVSKLIPLGSPQRLSGHSCMGCALVWCIIWSYVILLINACTLAEEVYRCSLAFLILPRSSFIEFCAVDFIAPCYPPSLHSCCHSAVFAFEKFTPCINGVLLWRSQKLLFYYPASLKSLHAQFFIDYWSLSHPDHRTQINYSFQIAPFSHSVLIASDSSRWALRGQCWRLVD